MKIKEIEKINYISFGTKSGSSLSFNVLVKVVPGMATTDRGYLNFVTTVKSKDPLQPLERRLLFLEDYGDDMPPLVKEKIFGKEANVIAVIDLDTLIFYHGHKNKNDLYLTEMSIPVKENSKEKLAANFTDSLNQKRPYHFEIDYWSVQSFLEGESGWSRLRDGLLGVIRLGDTRYIATYELE